jgi:hypothetical protein
LKLSDEQLHAMWQTTFPNVELNEVLQKSFFYKWSTQNLASITTAMQSAALWSVQKKNTDALTICKIICGNLRRDREKQEAERISKAQTRSWRESWTDAPLILSGDRYLREQDGAH